MMARGKTLAPGWTSDCPEFRRMHGYAHVIAMVCPNMSEHFSGALVDDPGAGVYDVPRESPTPTSSIVDDDLEIRQLLARYLSEQGFQVTTAESGSKMNQALAKRAHDLVVLDVILQDASGLDLCRALRARSTTPIILLTALKEDIDRIVGLELGADDYVSKPFNPRELLARIRAVLRRSTQHPGQGRTTGLCVRGISGRGR